MSISWMAFDGKGECKKIPSLGKDAKIPKRAKIDAYPTEEKYGIVFAFLGELPKSQRPPIMPIEELDDEEGWRPNYLTYEAKINYERSIENGLDAAHNEFVHPTHGHEGEDEDYKVNELKFEDSRFGVAKKWGFGFWHPFKSPGSKKEAQIKEASEKDGWFWDSWTQSCGLTSYSVGNLNSGNTRMSC